MTAREPAWAKVNLYLHVTGRRPDGYHLLDSLAVFPAIGDVVTATPSETLVLTLTGRFGAALTAEPDNLVLRAARSLAAQFGVTSGAALSLQKNLPLASGIGGGSSDAAAALRALCRLWAIAPPKADLMAIAATLGADVPVCLAQRPARMQGIGEILTPGPDLPECGMVLINPGQAVPTPAVFKARTGGFRPDAILPKAWRTPTEMAESLRSLHNDLEPPAIPICPAIADVLAALRSRPDCLLARMSGSGATCYGLFPTASAAEAAATALIHENWWVWGGAAQAGALVEQPGLPDHGRGP